MATSKSNPLIQVVLIDDDEFIRTALRLLLREADFTIAGEAKDAATGISMVERLQPDVVCLDIQMPGMDGLSALKTLRANWPQIGVLMVTASAERAVVKQALELGASGYVVKPFNASSVEKSVRVAASTARSIHPKP